MSCEYSIDSKRGVITVCARGSVDDRQILSCVEAIRGDIRFDPNLRGLYDFCGVADVHISIVGLSALAETQTISPMSRRAFLGDNNFVGQVSRMIGSLAKIQNCGPIKAYDNRAEATAWLNESEPASKRATGMETRVKLPARPVELPKEWTGRRIALSI